MQGVLGFKTYFQDTTASFREFEFKFRRRFQAEYPTEEKNHHPSVFARRAYDAIWATAMAVEKSKSDTQTLFQKILSSTFELSHLTPFQIVNVSGKSYRELGIWSPGFGFSKNLEKHDNTSNEAVLGPVFRAHRYRLWAHRRTSVPSGLMESSLPEVIARPLKVGVMATSTFTQFVEVSQDHNQNTKYITGISIEVFEAAVRYLGNPFIYKLIPFYGTWDELVNEVTLQNTKAIVGCDEKSFTIRYLLDVLGLKREYIKTIASIDDYAEALYNGHIRVFPKGSPLTLDISRAIVYLKETGRMQQLEDEKLSISDCLRLSSDDTGIPSLGPEPFAGLFYISGSVSAIALFIKLIQLLRENQVIFH
ncbi:hypothetical protein HS088_TW14G00280 [Tripterygium wilfordii]|uniref:Uncharacterized protein n=1 Tax=Tripterygium wilfordii TaxID=458696 RepID=A0A7J7CPW5_TRIWF|nr:hypothetical protein HS088_TW14G00280 [Tripterygium wilfordii]